MLCTSSHCSSRTGEACSIVADYIAKAYACSSLVVTEIDEASRSFRNKENGRDAVSAQVDISREYIARYRREVVS